MHKKMSGLRVANNQKEWCQEREKAVQMPGLRIPVPHGAGAVRRGDLGNVHGRKTDYGGTGAGSRCQLFHDKASFQTH